MTYFKNIPEMAKCELCHRSFTRGKYTKYRRFCGRNCAASYRASKRLKPRATCKLCGKQAPNPRQRACSARCAYELRKLKTRRPRRCLVCGTEYFHKGIVRLKYCSRSCYYKAVGDGAWIEGNCARCGLKVRRRRNRNRKQLFCSRQCSDGFFVAEKSPMWRGESDPNRGPGWIRLARQMRERDGHVCRRCGTTEAENGRTLHVDHIRPWRSFENKADANHPDNLASLCEKCHGYKTSKVERAWLRGDMLPMQAYEQSVRIDATHRVIFKERI